MGQHKLSQALVQERVKAAIPSSEYDELIANKVKYTDWVYKAYQLNLLSDYEEESMLPVKYTVVKAYLWSYVTNDPLRECIDNIVLKTSTMYTVGTRFLGGWVLEHEERFKDPNFFAKTLGNDTFLKHALRGHVEKLDPLIAESSTYGLVRNLYPTVNELKSVLSSMTAWNNLIGSIATLYKQAVRLHVLRHLWIRILGHLKNFTCRVMEASIVNHDHKKHFKKDGQILFPVSSVYEGITNEAMCSTLPEAIQTEIRTILGFFTASAIKELPRIPEKVTGDLFRLHLYLRSSVPMVEIPANSPCKNLLKVDVSKLEVDTNPEVVMYPSKGWHPVPISKMGRVHVTIDQSKVLPAIVEHLGLPKKTTLESLFGIDVESLKINRQHKRRMVRKAHHNYRKTHRGQKQRHRKSSVKNGMGIFKSLSKMEKCTPRTVLTDGVSMCIRYGILQTALPCKNTNEENLQDFVLRTNATLMADDPGRVNPFFMTRRSGKGFRHMKLSRRVYKIVGLSTHFQEERTNRKEIAVAAAEASMAETGGWKSRDLQGYKETMKVFHEHGKLMMEHYIQKDYTKFKMMSYRRKQSVIIQRFAHFIDVDKSTKFALSNRVRHPISKGIVVGVGNASFAPSGKGETPVPTTGIIKLLSRYLKCRGMEYKIVQVDEFRTTKCCHQCGNVLDNLRDSETHHVIRGLKSCRHCGTTKTDPVLLNRDANAAINILLCLEAMVNGRERPKYLKRQPITEERTQWRMARNT